MDAKLYGKNGERLGTIGISSASLPGLIVVSLPNHRVRFFVRVSFSAFYVEIAHDKVLAVAETAIVPPEKT